MLRKIFFLFLASILFPPYIFSQAPHLNVITIKGAIINPVIVEYIENALKETEAEDSYLLLRLDTPGGLLQSTEEIVKLLLNAKVPVICYVWPQGARAASAGTFIAYAANILAMAPHTHIGAAHPVLGGGSWKNVGKVMQEKILNDTLALAKNISAARGRNYEFIRKTIQQSRAFTASFAKAQGAVDFIAQDLPSLLKQINGYHVVVDGKDMVLKTTNIKIRYLALSRRQKFLNAIINPQIAYLLFSLGFLALLFEITHPGFGLAGVSGIISILLSLYAFQILPTNYTGLSLVAFGIIFLIAEAFTPTFGFFTVSGLVCFILGSLILFNQPQSMHLSLTIILPLGALGFVWSNIILAKVIQIRRKKPLSGQEYLKGKIGLAKTDIGDKGKVEIAGEIWNAKSKTFIPAGNKVAIENVEGLWLIVKPINQEG